MGIKKWVEDEKKNNIELVRMFIYQLLSDKNKTAVEKRAEASEKICDYIKQKEHIYTTRNTDAPEIWVYRKGVYIPEGETYIVEHCRDILQNLYSGQWKNVVLEKLMADTYISPEEFFKEADPRYICLNNGIYDVKKEKLIEFTPEIKMFTKITIDYKKVDIKKSKAIKIIKEIVKKEHIEFMKELFGYSLYRDYSLQKAIMFFGSGSNGKGTVLRLLQHMVGEDNYSSETINALEDNQYVASNLFHKLVNIAGDLPNKPIGEKAIFKNLTGQDPISADRKYKKPIKFISYAKQIFACNHLPRSKDESTGWWRRWCKIDFPYTFKLEKEATQEDKKDENVKIISERLDEKTLWTSEEREYLLCWALGGLSLIIKSGSFSMKKSVIELKREWTRQSNSVAAFFEDVLQEDYSGFIEKDDFRQVYNKYCHEYKLKPMSDRSIKSYLEFEKCCWESRKLVEDGEFKERAMVWCGCRFQDGAMLKYGLITEK